MNQTIEQLDEEKLTKLAKQLFIQPNPICIHLTGPLGAGKSTFVRAALRALGVTEAITSPTYTIVNEYLANGLEIRHMDFYRLNSPDECINLGLDAHFEDNMLVFVEWPSKAVGMIPAPDLVIEITPEQTLRNIHLIAQTDKGKGCLSNCEWPPC